MLQPGDPVTLEQVQALLGQAFAQWTPAMLQMFRHMAQNGMLGR